MKPPKITKKLSFLFLLSLMIITCLKLTSIYAIRKDFPCENLGMNSLSIDNFDDFELIVDSEYIESTKTSSELSFRYEGTTSSWVTERYLYIFDSQGNCSNITIQVDLEFSLNDVNDHIQAGLEVGSYYNSASNFVGAPPNSTDRIRTIAYVYDAWDASQATYATSLWGYGDEVKYIDTTNEAGLSGNVTVYQQRIGENITCSLKDVNDNSDYFTYTWNNQKHNINYLLIYINSRETYSNVSATFTSISGNLTFSDVSESTISFPGFTNIIILSGISIITILVAHIRKKKE